MDIVALSPGAIVSTAPIKGPLDPSVRVFDLFLTLTQSVLEPAQFQGVEGAGSCVMFDPTGQAFVCNAEIALDIKEIEAATGAGRNYIPLPPGTTIELTGAQFNKFFLRFTAAYLSTFPGTAFVGRLYVSPTKKLLSSGSIPVAPVYTREVPSLLTMGSLSYATDWSAVAAGVGNFQFRSAAAIPGTTISTTGTGMMVRVSNSGAFDIVLSRSSGLDGTGATVLDSGWLLKPGETLQWFHASTLNNFRQTSNVAAGSVFAYAATNAAKLNWLQEERQ